MESSLEVMIAAIITLSRKENVAYDNSGRVSQLDADMNSSSGQSSQTSTMIRDMSSRKKLTEFNLKQRLSNKTSISLMSIKGSKTGFRENQTYKTFKFKQILSIVVHI